MNFHVYGTVVRDGDDDQGRTKFRPDVTIAAVVDGRVVISNTLTADQVKAFGMMVIDVANSAEWQAALVQHLASVDDRSDAEIEQTSVAIDAIRNQRLGNYKRQIT